jgi:hypothetical protein
MNNKYNKYLPAIFTAGILLVTIGAVFTLSRPNQSKKTVTVEEKTAVTPDTSAAEKQVTPGQETQNTAGEIPLTISQPAGGTTVNRPSVTVKGKTAPRAEVFVNDYQTAADSKGNFSATLSLDEGENYLVVVANDTNGQSAEQEITVNYESGK